MPFGKDDGAQLATAVKLGAPVDPVQFPNIVSAPAFDSPKLRAGVVVGVATLVVKRGERFPLEKLVTEPAAPEPAACQVFAETQM